MVNNLKLLILEFSPPKKVLVSLINQHLNRLVEIHAHIFSVHYV